tara:strand:- start:4703 stop:5020 length:318 start_codon:yes stop_codon:yes gene_type:complete
MKIEVKYPLVKVCYMMSSSTIMSSPAMWYYGNKTLLRKQKKATLLEITKITFNSMKELHDLIDEDNKAVDDTYYPEIQDKMNKITEKLFADLHNEYLKMLAKSLK